MRQISHWCCEDHPTNLKKIISTGRYRAPICDVQSPLTNNWPCSRPMVLISPPNEPPALG
jgi:hypothetical protein